jgi:hypothetical protein
MVRTQIQLTEDQVRTLKKIALSRDLSVAELIRQAVDSMIKSSPASDPEERMKRALDVVGKFSSGKNDVSKHHDAYLAESYRR